MASKVSAHFLYRIVNFRHVIDLFETRQLHFSSPSLWDDPYECIWQHKRSAAIFAQCWCRRAVSDAMWRIYSPDRMAIRIRTTRAKLTRALETAASDDRFSYFVDDVDYFSPSQARLSIDRIAHEGDQNFELGKVIRALFIKRDAFDHEAEVRALVHDARQLDYHDATRFVRVPVDPHALIESIMFDPRADEPFMRMCGYYLQEKLGYSGSMGKSALYRLSELHLT